VIEQFGGEFVIVDMRGSDVRERRPGMSAGERLDCGRCPTEVVREHADSPSGWIHPRE
jgi:hypothetical protein